MDTRGLERNVVLYQLYTMLMFTPVMLPVIVLFWQANGLDMLQVYLLQGLFALAIALFELPTGMVADLWGKRASLLLGESVMASGVLVYAMGHSFAQFLVAEVLLALGFSLFSGAGSALLYDTLHALGREGEFTRLDGRSRALMMSSVAVSTMLGGWVGAHDLRLTVWLSATGPVLAFLIAARMVEVQTPAAHGSRRAAAQAYRKLVGDSARFVRRHRLVRWQILFLGVLGASSAWLLWLYQPYMQQVGLPVWAFGIAFTVFNLFAAASSHRAHALDARFGRTGTILVLMLLQILPPLLMASLMARASVLLILAHQAVRGTATPIFSARILRYTFADKRATVLSLASLSTRLLFALSAPLVGLAARAWPLSASLWLQGVVTLALLCLLLWSYRRIPAKYFVVKSSVAERI